MARSSGRLIFNFLWNCQFPKGYHFTFPLVMYERLVPPHPWLHLVWWVIYVLVIVIAMWQYLILIFIFRTTVEVEHLFTCSFAIHVFCVFLKFIFIFIFGCVGSSFLCEGFRYNIKYVNHKIKKRLRFHQN